MTLRSIALQQIVVRSALVLALAAAALPPAAQSQEPPAPAVLLTFDVEEPGDAALLEGLNVDVPATYFFTGDYGRQFPELVRSLAEAGNSIGSHSHFHDDLTTLTPRHLALDLILSRVTLESITCRPVTWFRAPYLTYDESVMQGIVDAGYMADSSDKLPWPVNAMLPELAISVHDGRLVSDIDTLEPADGSAPRGLPFLIAAFEEQRERGLPLVVLMHPRVIGPQPEVLHGLIAHARAAGAEFLTADAFLQRARTGRERKALWLQGPPPTDGGDALRRAIVEHGITDLVLPSSVSVASDPERSASWVPAPLAGLRDLGVRLHLVLDVREANSGSLLDQAKAQSVTARTSALARDPAVDGIVLVGLDQSSVNDGLTESTLDLFAADTGIVGITADTLMGTAYLEWIQWRTDRITALVTAIAKTAHDVSDGRIGISAVVPSDLILDFAQIEITALNLPQLAPNLDAVFIVLPGDKSQEPLLHERLRLAAAVQTGATDVFLPQSEPTGILPDYTKATLLQAGSATDRSTATRPNHRMPCTGFEGHWSLD